MLVVQSWPCDSAGDTVRHDTTGCTTYTLFRDSSGLQRKFNYANLEPKRMGSSARYTDSLARRPSPLDRISPLHIRFDYS